MPEGSRKILPVPHTMLAIRVGERYKTAAEFVAGGVAMNVRLRHFSRVRLRAAWQAAQAFVKHPPEVLPSRTQGAMAVAGLALLSAAVLKAYDLAIRGGGAWPQVALIESEAFLAIWFLSGFYSRWAWRAAIASFALLSCVAGYKLLSGADSCGCLGALRLSPGLALVFDAAMLGALLHCPPSAEGHGGRSLLLLRNTTVGQSVLLSVVLVAASYGDGHALQLLNAEVRAQVQN